MLFCFLCRKSFIDGLKVNCSNLKWRSLLKKRKGIYFKLFDQYALGELRSETNHPWRKWIVSKDGRGIKAHDVCMLTVHQAQLAYKLEVQKLARTPVNLQYLYSKLL